MSSRRSVKTKASGRTRDYAGIARQYAEDVLSGRVPACKWVKAAARRQLDDLRRKWSYTFDVDKACRACRFIELMPHIKGEWARRQERIRLEPWQVFIVAAIFGWVEKRTGRRRFRTVYLEVARKNAKSTLLAAIGLYMLAMDGEAGAEVYSAATTRDQARIVYDVAAQMAKRSPEFCADRGVEIWARAIAVEDSASQFAPLSSEGDTLDGLSVHFGSIDELHAHRTREVWDVMETATGARLQSLIFAITTAGTNRAGICYEQRLYLTKILNDTLHAHDGLGYKIDGDRHTDETYFGLIYTLDDADDWTDERVWVKANPNLNVSVRLDDLQRKARKAMSMASAAPNFQTKHCNLWVNADSSWMDMRAWDRAAARIEPADFLDWEWYFGLDLASKRDVASMVMLAKKGGETRIFSRHWLPEDAIEDSDNSQYAGWAENGHLIATDGNVIDHELLMSEIYEWAGKLHPRAIAYDPGYDRLIPHTLQNKGLPMVEVRATVMNFSEPMKQCEADVLSGTLMHDGNPVLTWMVSNIVCHRDAKDNIYPRKERDDNKIDGVIAWILGRSQCLGADVSSLRYLT
jgi:phage terminase large subunit-like protein